LRRFYEDFVSCSARNLPHVVCPTASACCNDILQLLVVTSVELLIVQGGVTDRLDRSFQSQSSDRQTARLLARTLYRNHRRAAAFADPCEGLLLYRGQCQASDQLMRFPFWLRLTTPTELCFSSRSASAAS
jgi:hypothetical protein